MAAKVKTEKPSCGYVNCSCGTCFDTAVCSRPLGEKHAPEHHLCLECEEAGCDPSGDEDCMRAGQYECHECGADDHPSSECPNNDSNGED